MLKIGPAGNSTTFYESGKKSTLEAAKWLSEIGLTAFEYSFGRGINISDESAVAIGNEMKKYNIALSGHAPYYINFANTESELIQKSFDYVKHSLKKTLLMSGNRVVFHAATQGKMPRSEAMDITKRNIEKMLEYVLSNNDINKSNFILCPETMGKLKQIGTVEEIVDICTLSDILYPCFDFGHINCYTGGGLKTADDYRRLIDYTFERLGKEKTFNMHIHFSKIQYGSSGEIRHLTLADEVFGPEYLPLARVIEDYKMTPVIICESHDIMSDDALIMQKCHKELGNFR